jgi:putative membrane protein
MPVDIAQTNGTNGRHAHPLFLSEHLANERTYLAYLRTAVSLMSFGIAINRFSAFLIQSSSTSDRPRPATQLLSSERLGIGMVAVGMVLLIWAAVHYNLILRQIERQDFQVRPGGILILTGLVLVCGAGSVLWLFLG